MNTANTKRLIFWAVPILLLGLVLLLSMRTPPVIVDIQEISEQSLEVTVEAEGITQVRDVYEVSAPVTGRLRRLQVEVGDSVVLGESMIAEIEPIDPEFLDSRSAAQAQAGVRAAESAKALALADLKQTQVELDFARREMRRAEELMVKNTISQREYDETRRQFRSAQAAIARSQAALQVREYEVESARALLVTPAETQAEHGKCQCITLTSPATGKILQTFHESEGVILAGEPVATIGNPKLLEIVADLHSTEAVKVKSGQRVEVRNWGGSEVLEATVRRVEPFGFTKISALGIEEQRVNVVIDLLSDKVQWEALGHGYQLDVHIELWQSDNVLTVPLTALFREGTHWSLFVVEDDEAVKRKVKVGQKNRFSAEIVEGLTAGETIIVHPGDKIEDGTPVEQREG